MVARGTAARVRISDVLGAHITKEETGTFAVLQDSTTISKVNIIGTIVAVEQEQNNAVLDDGSGHIRLQFFDGIPSLFVGQLVLCIGKIREFGEPYIVPDFVKSIDPKWALVRQKELKAIIPTVVNTEEKTEEIKIEKAETGESISQRIIKAIKEVDTGTGADEETILSKVGDNRTEKTITNLIRNGEVFYTAPGKLKVLE